VTSRKPGGAPARSAAPPRVGLFGKLGSGNIGNDASLEAVLDYLRTDHPEAVLDAMCTGSDTVTDRYGIPAIPLFWYQKHAHLVSGIPAIPLKALGKGIDALRTIAWVRRHDAVIVPGMGVLETSLPLPTWEFPYAMFLLGGSSRLFGTRVALVSVGAGAINHRTTRWLFNTAARFAYYRSFRNASSRDAMQQRGLDTGQDQIFPDLAFALPAPSAQPGDARLVCVGVMEYHGSNDDRERAAEIRSSYMDGMKRFVRWLVDRDRRVLLLIGDTNGSDQLVIEEILADLRENRPGLDQDRVVAQPVVSFADVMQAIQPAGTVVAIRFHNVIAALKLCKPTIAIGYSAKHRALMADMGVPQFWQVVYPFDFDLLIERFAELEDSAGSLRQMLAEHNEVNKRRLDEQFAELSAALFPASGPSRTAAGREPVQPGTR
jgi:polysaccharide pyruvyl transferase WcaK-like protein